MWPPDQSWRQGEKVPKHTFNKDTHHCKFPLMTIMTNATIQWTPNSLLQDSSTNIFMWNDETPPFKCMVSFTSLTSSYIPSHTHMYKCMQIKYNLLHTSFGVLSNLFFSVLCPEHAGHTATLFGFHACLQLTFSKAQNPSKWVQLDVRLYISWMVSKMLVTNLYWRLVELDDLEKRPTVCFSLCYSLGNHDSGSSFCLVSQHGSSRNGLCS